MASIDTRRQIRDSKGHFTGKIAPLDPPLVNFQITNPLTYIKAWWKRIISNEGVDFRFRIHPLTAIAIVVIITSGSFGLGLLARSPLSPFLPFPQIPQTPQTPQTPAIDTAFTGILKYSQSTQKYYLLTKESQAITLTVPQNVKLTNLIGKRIFATGTFNKDTSTLLVQDATSMEVLPTNITPIPTLATPSAQTP